MNYELEHVARSQLARNEKLLWSGQPRGGGSGWPGASRYQPPTFEMIENVRNVHTILRDAQASVGAAGA